MRIRLLAGLVGVSVLFTQCTKDFAEKNTDPNQQSPGTFNAEYFLASAENEYKGAITGYESGFIFESGWAQVLAAPSTGYLSNMDKYVESSNTNDYASRAWNDCYRSAGYSNAIIQKHAADADKVNLVSTATVMKILAMQYITDVYGDVPYSNALQGFDGTSLGVIFPSYDKQQDIYTSMLNELDAALSKFDPSKSKAAADLIYGGDVTKWKKFGYSLMLRMAMRLTKVDAAKAQTYAEKAFAGGVFASNADNALLKGENATAHGSENPRVMTLQGDIEYIRWGKDFINYLKTTSDPRLPVISEVVDLAAAVDVSVVPTVSNTTPASQFGVPNGYVTSSSSSFYIGNEPNYPGAVGTGSTVAEILGKYSRPKRALYYNLDGPIFFLSYAETSLLLAEAKFRGWNVGATSAEGYYQQGIAAALGTYTTFNTSVGAIDAGTINTYASAQTLTAGQELKQINTQIWLATGSFLNFTEAWINWRRSGYPELTKVTYTGQFASEIPRRHIYPTTEATTNGANYSSAVSGLTGGDKWISRVWWDK
jgi:Starch-binding associating with outer membrane